MPEESSSTAPADNGGGRLWKGLRGLLFGDDGESSLRDELEATIDEHSEQPPPDGDLSPVERQMLKRLLHFGESTADDVCVPRADIVAVEESESFESVVKVFAEAGHSRLPVFRQSLDQVIGMIHIRDVFAALVADERPETIESFIREPRYVPESMGVLDLLAEMQTTRTHMAIVIDEYSGTEGIVTIEDIVEEIVGEIEDEHDEEATELLTPHPDGSWDAEARAELDDVAELLGDPRLGEIDEDVDTLGGLAFVLAGRVPEQGDTLDHPSGWRLEITESDSRRVSRLRLYPPPAVETGGNRK
ncbi:MAG: hemolysin family protein [Parasphingopyxis sp.]